MKKEITLLNSAFFQQLEMHIAGIIDSKLLEFEEKIKEKDEWLTIEEACNYLKVTEPTLWKYSKKNGILKKHYLAGNPRYRKSELDNALVELITYKGGAYA